MIFTSSSQKPTKPSPMRMSATTISSTATLMASRALALESPCQKFSFRMATASTLYSSTQHFSEFFYRTPSDHGGTEPSASLRREY